MLVKIKMTSEDQYYNPLIVGQTVRKDGELWTITNIYNNSNGSDELRMNVEPLINLDEIQIN